MPGLFAETRPERVAPGRRKRQYADSLSADYGVPCSRERFFVEARKPDDGDATKASSRRADDAFGGKDPRDGRSLPRRVRA